MHLACSRGTEGLRSSAPDDPVDRASLLQQRAILLLDRHRRGGDSSDLDAALAALRDAAETNPNHAAVLDSLATALMDDTDYAASDGGPVSHLDLAIEATERAVEDRRLSGNEVNFAVAHA